MRSGPARCPRCAWTRRAESRCSPRPRHGWIAAVYYLCGTLPRADGVTGPLRHERNVDEAAQ